MERPEELNNILVVNIKRCTGCRSCELACSIRHTTTFNPRRSRIQILRDEARNVILPVVCLHCEQPLCIEACPTGAIREDKAGSLTIDAEKCIGCADCMTACVYGGVVLDPTTRRAVKCDLCEGDPACVKACGYGAIMMLPREPQGAQERFEETKTVLQAYHVIKEEA
jgi:carbon-monoxide dehydrogenase iron sulfur subunit